MRKLDAHYSGEIVSEYFTSLGQCGAVREGVRNFEGGQCAQRDFWKGKNNPQTSFLQILKLWAQCGCVYLKNNLFRVPLAEKGHQHRCRTETLGCQSGINMGCKCTGGRGEGWYYLTVMASGGDHCRWTFSSWLTFVLLWIVTIMTIWITGAFFAALGGIKAIQTRNSWKHLPECTEGSLKAAFKNGFRKTTRTFCSFLQQVHGSTTNLFGSSSSPR